jgi:thymidylate synthase
MSIHDDTYATMLKYILKEGDSHADRTGTGTTSVFGYQNRYDLSKGFPLLTTKRMAWKSIVVELAWFLLGRTDNKWLTDRGVKIWDEWATKEQCAKFGREEGDLGPVYGAQWRNFGATPMSRGRTASDGVDQIKNLCHDLDTNPNSRRMIVTGWNPAEATQVALPPCHTLWHCKVRTVEYWEQDVYENKIRSDKYLDLQLYQRSADSFLGVPFNIASYALLLQLLAHTHGLKPGRFIHAFGDLHVYNNHKDQVKLQLERDGFDAPIVVFPGSLRDQGFDAVMRWATDVGEAALNPDVKFRLNDASNLDSMPVALCGYKHHDAIKAEVSV